MTPPTHTRPPPILPALPCPPSAVLLKKFVMSGAVLEAGDEDPYEHVASILTSVTRYKAGRDLLLQPGRGLLHALVAQLPAHSAVRRHGSAGSLRNCVMFAEVGGWMAGDCVMFAEVGGWMSGDCIMFA